MEWNKVSKKEIPFGEEIIALMKSRLMRILILMEQE